VDWTVRAVMAEVPKRRWAAKVWRSAVIPAPLEGSWPAMVRRERVLEVGGEERVGKEGNPMKRKHYHIQQKFASDFRE
jgi:hypothetical protein